MQFILIASLITAGFVSFGYSKNPSVRFDHHVMNIPQNPIPEVCYENGKFNPDIGTDDLDCGNL